MRKFEIASGKGREMAVVEMAMDGEHWEVIKKGEVGKMWDYFNFDTDIREHLFLNPQAKFRLVSDSGSVIGVLPRPTQET